MIRLNGQVLTGTKLKNLTQEQFNQLTYTAESTTEKPPPTGFITISAEFTKISSLGIPVKVLSNPYQIAVAATGVTSPNATPALLSTAATVNAFGNFTNNVLASATANGGYGSAATLSSTGSFTDSAAGAVINLSTSITTTQSTVAGAVKAYQIALTGDVGLPNSGYLTLDGTTNLLNDTRAYNPSTGIYTIDAADWSKLKFVSGGQGTHTSINVAAINLPNGAAANAAPIYSQFIELVTSVAPVPGAGASDSVGQAVMSIWHLPRNYTTQRRLNRPRHSPMRAILPRPKAMSFP